MANRKIMNYCFATLCLILCLAVSGEAIKCFQCSSGQDLKKEDNCAAYNKFDKARHVPIDCNSDESNTPGSFCMKITQQGPKGFIWDGRWRQVIRRCASVSDTGVTGVCNWGVYENGIYWEECYCGEDGCNDSTTIRTSLTMLTSSLALCIVFTRWMW